jgi:SynChlorMet cassette protein ScmD
MPLDENNIVAVNPSVVLREEFDNWAILFDPDSNVTLGINPTGAYIWRLMDGKRTVKEILDKLHDNCEGISNDVFTHLTDFIEDLVKKNLATLDK